MNPRRAGRNCPRGYARSWRRGRAGLRRWSASPGVVQSPWPSRWPFRIPLPEYVVYLVFVISRRESVATLVTAVGVAVGATLAVSLSIVLLTVDAGDPALRLPLMAGIAFLTMYLARVSTLGPLAYLVGFIMVLTQTMVDTVPSPEMLTRLVLWLWVVVMIPAVISTLVNLGFRRGSGQACAADGLASARCRHRDVGRTPFARTRPAADRSTGFGRAAEGCADRRSPIARICRSRPSPDRNPRRIADVGRCDSFRSSARCPDAARRSKRGMPSRIGIGGRPGAETAPRAPRIAQRPRSRRLAGRGGDRQCAGSSCQ